MALSNDFPVTAFLRALIALKNVFHRDSLGNPYFYEGISAIEQPGNCHIYTPYSLLQLPF